MSIFKLNILIIFLFYILNVSFAIAQDDEDPFIDFEKEVEKTDQTKPEPSKKAKKNKKDKNIKNPKTYLSAKNYTLKGVVISDDQSFAIVGTEKTEDLVISLGEMLGSEGWKILEIANEYIIVGENNNKSVKLHIID